MSFKFTNSDGAIVTKLYSCTECIYISTKKHFKQTDNGLTCLLCHSEAEHRRTIEQDDSMSQFQYQQILRYLLDNCGGVGDSTVQKIEEQYEDGNDFLDACKQAYKQQQYDELAAIPRVGEATARKIALSMADMKGWEGGLAESKFKLS